VRGATAVTIGGIPAPSTTPSRLVKKQQSSMQAAQNGLLNVIG